MRALLPKFREATSGSSRRQGRNFFGVQSPEETRKELLHLYSLTKTNKINQHLLVRSKRQAEGQWTRHKMYYQFYLYHDCFTFKVRQMRPCRILQWLHQTTTLMIKTKWQSWSRPARRAHLLDCASQRSTRLLLCTESAWRLENRWQSYRSSQTFYNKLSTKRASKNLYQFLLF